MQMRERNALFDRMDCNGNGGLSLAEIDKAVLELWPQFNHKKALMRAYRVRFCVKHLVMILYYKSRVYTHK